jgi:hypothetical protein
VLVLSDLLNARVLGLMGTKVFQVFLYTRINIQINFVHHNFPRSVPPFDSFTSQTNRVTA